jgi:hypothetical protein
MEGQLVADFILRMTFGLGEPAGWKYSMIGSSTRSTLRSEACVAFEL